MSQINTIEAFRSKENYKELLNSYVTELLEDTNKLAYFVYNCAALEAALEDFLSLKQVLSLVTGEKTKIKSKRPALTYEVFGLLDCLKMISEDYNLPVTEEVVLAMHKLTEKSNSAGKYRYEKSFYYQIHPINGVSRCYHTGVNEMHEIMRDLYSRSSKMTLDEIALYKLDFIKANPFNGGNGRISRLLLNWLLLHNGYPPVNIKVEDRKEYMLALNKYKSEGDSQDFMEMLEKLIVDVLNPLCHSH